MTYHLYDTEEQAQKAKRPRLETEEGSSSAPDLSEAAIRSLSIPGADQIKYFPSQPTVDINEALLKIQDEHTMQPMQLFFNFKDRLKAYAGAHRTKLDSVLLKVSDLLDQYKIGRLSKDVCLLSSVTDDASFEVKCNSLTDLLHIVVFKALYESIRSGVEPRFTVERARDLVDGWIGLADSLRKLPCRRDIAIPCQITNLVKVIEDVKDLFSHSLFKRIFLKVINDDKQNFDKFRSSNDECMSFKARTPLPFDCICSPSGSGKSTFAMNMCCEESLAVYLLFSRASAYDVDSKITQDNYVPFMGISEVFIFYLNLDSKTLGLSNDFKRDIAESRFAIIGFIVGLIQELHRLKSLPENSGKTWLELEARMSHIEFVEMTAVEAFKIIREIQRQYPDAPLTFFIDETKLSRNPSNSSEYTRDMRRLMTVRGILRCLGITVVFLGTDMRVSNFFKKEGPYSGITHVNQTMSNIFNTLPRYDEPRLESFGKKVINIHNKHPHIKAFLKLLAACREHDNPWLIRLALEFIMEHPYTSPDDYFDRLFCSLFTSFGERKSYSEMFLEGQLKYMMFYTWSKLVQKEGKKALDSRPTVPETCINGHFGHLCGDPRYPSTKPYFSLFITAGNERCFVDARSGQGKSILLRNCRFKPKAVFIPFDKAPLTGLTAFGFGPYHCPLQLRGLDMQIYNALWELKDGPSDGTPSSGNVLEKIANYSCLHSSRVNGVRGSPFPMFFLKFVKSLMTSSDVADTTEILNMDTSFWNQFTIPFISPMALCKWNEDLVVFFKTVYGNDIHIGVMNPSLGQDPVDCVVYNSNTSEVSTAESDVESVEQNLDTRKDPISEESTLKESKAEKEPLNREYLQLDAIIPKYTNSKNIALCIECKQHKEGLHNAAIKEVLDGKFKNEHFEECPIFILLALRFNENINPEHQDFHIWRLVEDPTAKSGPTLSLKEFAGSNQNATKQVILVDLETLYAYGSVDVEDLSEIKF